MTPAELIEAALRDQMRVCAGVPMSGSEAEDAARIAVDALTGAGLVVVPAADYRHVLDCAEQFAMYRFDADDSILVARLRAALPEERPCDT
ncbi:hypothetical protein [Streptosporangium sp. CA-115845]|uniref:hypothetical protein n=1 Tax=Streptosporangium sp. CA-115845 TaxID=3240071 RepID=UPI003D935626